MLELAAHLRPGWTAATEIVQLNGAISRSARPTRAQEVVERFGTHDRRRHPAHGRPRDRRLAELRDALEADPVGRRDARGRTRRRHRGLRHGRPGARQRPRRLGLPRRRGARRARGGRRRRRRARPLPRARRPHRAARRSTSAPSGCRSTSSARRRSPWASRPARAAARSRSPRCAPAASTCSSPTRPPPRGCSPMAEPRTAPLPTRSARWSRRIVDATLAAGRRGAAAAAARRAPAPATAAPRPCPDRAGRVAHRHRRRPRRLGAQGRASARMLAEAGYAVHDCGTNGPEAVDYPDIAHAVARLVADGTCRWGIVVDGAGIGSCMVANKVPGRPGRALPRPLVGAQQPRAQPRQRPDPGRALPRRGPCHRDRAGLARRPTGGRAATRPGWRRSRRSSAAT